MLCILRVVRVYIIYVHMYIYIYMVSGSLTPQKAGTWTLGKGFQERDLIPPNISRTCMLLEADQMCFTPVWNVSQGKL